MKSFEYHVLEINSGFFSGFDQKEFAEQLNRFGRLGWEVVTTVSVTSAGSTTSLLVTFKREIQS